VSRSTEASWECFRINVHREASILLGNPIGMKLTGKRILLKRSAMRRMRRNAILALVLVLAAWGSGGCGGDPSLDPRDRVPGTESVIPAADCLSLAPDGRWLVFVEDTARVPANGDSLDSRWPRYRPVSLDLTTGQRTVHHCAADLEFGLPHPPALQNLSDAKGFKPHAWRDGRFYGLNVVDSRHRCLVLDPGRSDLVVDARPELRHLQSSDQMSPDRLAGRLQRLEEKWNRRHWRPTDVTLPLDRDVPAEFFYFSDKEHVFRADADGDSVCASFKEGRIVERLRISPDRRFLACVTRERKTFMIFVGGTSSLVVLDLESGDRRTLLAAPAIDALVWAPDGEALYVSAQDDREYGIYRLRMDEFFALD